jgi:hypothetical protein
MAALITVAFLTLTDQAVSAKLAMAKSLKEKIMLYLVFVCFPGKHELNAIEEALGNQWLVYPLKDLTGLSNGHKPNVKDVVKEL